MCKISFIFVEGQSLLSAARIDGDGDDDVVVFSSFSIRWAAIKGLGRDTEEEGFST